MRIAAAIVCALWVGGCGLWPFRTFGDKARPSATAEDAPTARPSLRVGTSGDYPPFSTVDPAGGLAGFDVEVARAFADADGSRLELVRFRWPQLAKAIAAGEFAVAMSGVTVRPERLIEGEMTAAVAVSRALLVTLEPTPAKRSKRGAPRITVGDAAQPGFAIGVNAGGHLERLGRARFPAANWRRVDDNRQLAGLLRSGQARAVLTDDLELPVVEADLGERVRVLAELSRDRKAYWTAPGRSSLRNALDQWLTQREADGSMSFLREHLLGPDAGRVGATNGTGSGLAIGSPAVRVADLVGRRLMLMPMVAATKRVQGLPVRDPRREGAVLAAARDRAEAVGLDPVAAMDLANAQIEAACRVQEAHLASAAPEDTNPPTLEKLRATIEALDARLTDELARAAPLTTSEADLTALLGEMAGVAVPEPDLRAIAQALRAQARVKEPVEELGSPRSP